MGMRRLHPVYLSVSFLILVVTAAAVLATENGTGDWKRGRIYYRLVCNACHKEETGQAITIPHSLVDASAMSIWKTAAIAWISK